MNIKFEIPNKPIQPVKPVQPIKYMFFRPPITDTLDLLNHQNAKKIQKMFKNYKQRIVNIINNIHSQLKKEAINNTVFCIDLVMYYRANISKQFLFFRSIILWAKVGDII